MPSISAAAIDLIEAPIRQASAAGVGRTFFEALRPFGVRAIYARAYRQPRSDVAEEEHVFSRISPPVGRGSTRKTNSRISTICRARCAGAPVPSNGRTYGLSIVAKRPWRTRS